MSPQQNTHYLRLLYSIVSAILLLAITHTTWAESVVVKRDRIFVADGGLIAKDLHTGELLQCTAPPLLDPVGNDVTDLLGTATDVVIKHDYAIITIHPQDNEGNPFVDTVTVNIANCFEVKTVTVDECISTVDLQQGLLVIPCVDVNGSYVTLHMDRRGRSDNWKVKFFGDNHDVARYKHKKYKHRHDDDDEYDD